MISCRRATELMSKELDSGLNLWERLLLRTHLMMCGMCVACYEQFKCIGKGVKIICLSASADTGTLSELQQLIPEECLPEAARQRIKASLAAALQEPD